MTTAERGQCVIIMDCVVGDEKTVTTAESGQCIIINGDVKIPTYKPHTNHKKPSVSSHTFTPTTIFDYSQSSCRSPLTDLGHISSVTYVCHPLWFVCGHKKGILMSPLMDCVMGDEETVTTAESGQCVIIMSVVGLCGKKTMNTAESGQCVIIMDCVMEDEETVTTAGSSQCVIIIDCVVGDEKSVTTAESGQCVIIIDCVVGDEKTVTTAKSGQSVIIMDCVVRRL